MTNHRAGQRVRAEWPDGSAVEGVCEWRAGNDLVIPVGDIVVGLGALLAKNCTVTVLAEPRPDEPTGLGAVVEAGIADWEPRLWVRTFYGTWACTEPVSPVDWSELRNPVVLSEGWTP